MDGRRQGAGFKFCDLWYIQLYFYDNLFNLNENSKIQNKSKLNKRTIVILLNELFVLDDQDKSEETIRQYAQNMGIVVT